MDIIILGLLMIKKCTVYEIRKIIETKLTSVSSNSTGSIQAAIKKLMEKNMICFCEYVENSVNKKVYEITDAGKKYFYLSISKPMRCNEKSMELGKFFFMGFADKDDRPRLIEGYIKELKAGLDGLELIKLNTAKIEDFDENYLAALKEQGGAVDMKVEGMREIAFFQCSMLDFSIAKIKFEIDWFEKFKSNLQ